MQFILILCYPRKPTDPVCEPRSIFSRLNNHKTIRHTAHTMFDTDGDIINISNMYSRTIASGDSNGQLGEVDKGDSGVNTHQPLKFLSEGGERTDKIVVHV